MQSLAFALIQDSSSQTQINNNAAAGIGVAAVLFFVLIGLAVVAFMVFMFWRIFTKAGLPGPLGLLLLIGPIGVFINICILAFAEWKVAPVARLPTAYAPPPSYPLAPPSYPPSHPPAA